MTPGSGAALFHKDSNTGSNVSRPSTLKVNSPGASPPASSPIPVPTQVAAYNRMQANSPTSPLVQDKVMDQLNANKKVCYVDILLQIFS